MALLVGCVRIMLSPCACIRVLEREGESGWPVRLMHKYTACSLAHGLVNEENAYVDKCKGLSVTESLNIITHAHASTHTDTHKAANRAGSVCRHTWWVQTACQHLTARGSNQDSDADVPTSPTPTWLVFSHPLTPPTHPCIHSPTHEHWYIITPHLSAKRFCFFFFLLSCFIQKYTRVSEWECRLFLYCACACLRVSVRACVHTVFFYTWLPSLLDIIIVIWSPW